MAVNDMVNKSFRSERPDIVQCCIGIQVLRVAPISIETKTCTIGIRLEERWLILPSKSRTKSHVVGHIKVGQVLCVDGVARRLNTVRAIGILLAIAFLGHTRGC